MSDSKTDLVQSLMDSAYAKIQDRQSIEDWHDSLTPQERSAVMLGNLNYQVQNGGFSQWVCNGYCLVLDDLVRVYQRFIAWAKEMEMATEAGYAMEVVEMLGQIEPLIDFDQRDRGCLGNYLVSDKDDEDVDSAWENLSTLTELFDTRYYKMDDALLEAFEKWFAAGGF